MSLALASGLLSALSLPTVLGGRLLPDLGFLAWVALVPLYLTLPQPPPLEGGGKGEGGALSRGFIFGFAYGLTHYGLSLYWIFIAMHKYGEVPVPLSLLGLVLAVVIEAVFPAAAILVATLLTRRRIPLAVSFPLSWVVFEFARTYFPFGGFAWAGLAYSQRSFLTLLQSLDLTGVYGPLLLILLANVMVAETWWWFRDRRGAASGAPTKLIVVFVVLLLVTLGYGRVRLGQVRRSLRGAETIKISMIQGNIPQEEKWIEEKMEEIIHRHIALTEEAEGEGTDFIIWPEAAYPAVIPPEISRVELLKGLKVPLLMGVVTFEGTIPWSWPPRPGDKDFALHNSAVLIQPGGWITDRYDKNHLVPMGEYVPLGRLLFFLNQVVPSVSSFSPGGRLNLMSVSGARVAPSTGQARGASPSTALRAWLEEDSRVTNFGVTICYEDLFPGISRTFTRKGADFLVNLTNDGWYEHSSAVFQHFDFSRHRAIENRRAMVRATNTGVTGFFSPTGEVISQAPVFQEAVLTAEVPLGGPASFYARFGDRFAWGCVGALGLLVIFPSFVRRGKGR